MSRKQPAPESLDELQTVPGCCSNIASDDLVDVLGRLSNLVRRPLEAVRLVDRQGTQHRVTIPEGVMADIVTPLWEDEVTVIARKMR